MQEKRSSNGEGDHPGYLEKSGMSETQFQKAEAKMAEELQRMEAEAFASPHHEYYVFKSMADKENALKLVEEYRQDDDAFRYLDPGNYNQKKESSELTFNFIKTDPENETRIISFFTRHGLLAERIHHTDDKGREVFVMARDPKTVGESLKGHNVVPISEIKKWREAA